MGILCYPKACRKRCKEKLVKCGHFTYDKKTRKCCGRTVKNWCSLITFYVLYISFTVSGFFGVLFLMMHIIDVQGQEGLRNKLMLFTDACPALEIFPKVRNLKAPMLWYSNKRNGHLQSDVYVNQINQFLERYGNLNKSVYVDCSKMKRKPGQYCKFSRKELGPCGKANYGYDTNQPCIFLKLNKLVGWDPKDYRPVMNIDEEDRIGNEIVMVTCKAKTHYDAEHLGPISYYPGNGFLEYFFPYDGSDMYLAPLIAIQFPKIQTGFVIGIKCLTFDVGINRKNEAYYTDTIYLYIEK